jgi:hypothetical protein
LRSSGSGVVFVGSSSLVAPASAASCPRNPTRSPSTSSVRIAMFGSRHSSALADAARQSNSRFFPEDDRGGAPNSIGLAPSRSCLQYAGRPAAEAISFSAEDESSGVRPLLSRSSPVARGNRRGCGPSLGLPRCHGLPAARPHRRRVRVQFAARPSFFGMLRGKAPA